MIGCGDVTEIKSGPGLYKAENSSLSALYNRTYEKALDYAGRHKIPKVYKTAEELLADREIDAVYIATPPVSHFEYARLTLKAGKIPYIEKPLVTNYEDALKLKELSVELNLPVYVAFYRRGLEKFIRIKSLLEQGILGKIRYVQITQIQKAEDGVVEGYAIPWRVKPEISGGGLFLDVGVHVLDCLIWYFGEMEYLRGTVSNQGGYYDAEDTVHAEFRFKKGVSGSATWCFVADRNETAVTICGERGRIEYDGMSPDNFSLIIDEEEQLHHFDVPQHIAMPLEQAIVDELTGRGKSHADFDQAVNLVEMTDNLLREYYSR